MKRRTFFKRSAFVGVPLLINGQSIAALAKTTMPRPFYDQTDKILVMIQLDGGNDEGLTIDLFKNLGQKQKRLCSGITGFGQQQLQFDLSGLQSGPYYCRITQGSKITTLKSIKK